MNALSRPPESRTHRWATPTLCGNAEVGEPSPDALRRELVWVDYHETACLPLFPPIGPALSAPTDPHALVADATVRRASPGPRSTRTLRDLRVGGVHVVRAGTAGLARRQALENIVRLHRTLEHSADQNTHSRAPFMWSPSTSAQVWKFRMHTMAEDARIRQEISDKSDELNDAVVEVEL